MTVLFKDIAIGTLFKIGGTVLFKTEERFLVTSTYNTPKTNAVVVYDIRSELIGKHAFVEYDAEVWRRDWHC